MTVKQLIKLLESEDPDKIITIYQDDYPGTPGIYDYEVDAYYGDDGNLIRERTKVLIL